MSDDEAHEIPDHHQTRELLVSYLARPADPETLLAGVTTDRAMLNLYHGICKQESDAWVLRTLDILPSWWPLVDSVHVRHLTDFQDDTEHPEANAKLRLDGMPEDELAALRLGWRIMRTATGGRIVRLPQRARKPIVKDPKIFVVLADLKIRKPVGPYVPYEPNVIIT